MKTAMTFEGQRTADLGNGKYQNPIISGDHADPTILKDGSDYYMTFSSFLAYPGIVIWHSRDLVNWAPLCTALGKPIGSVWALDIVKHNNRYFIYIPAVGETYSSIYVIWADTIAGPWSEPIDLGIQGCIDPGHAVGEDGKRYLFFNGIRRIALSDDGLSTVGNLEKVYEPWRYPEDWVVEMFAPEGPKIARRGKYFYLISAVGGTAGPATSHMVIAARSTSINGPWENCPRNPVIHTKSSAERWWSKGHASIVEGPSGDWWMVYHAYENGYRTLGRQTLLEPVRWTSDGWFEPAAKDPAKPIRKPRGGTAGAALFPLSDDFSTDKVGIQWSFFNASADERQRLCYGERSLSIQARGTGLADTKPLAFLVGDLAYEVEVGIEPEGTALGALALYYSERMFCGVGFDRGCMYTWHYGQEHSWMRVKLDGKSVRIRLANVGNVATIHYSLDGGKEWVRHPWQMEVSGMNHNVFGGFTSLKVALFSAGEGSVTFRDFRYRGL